MLGGGATNDRLSSQQTRYCSFSHRDTALQELSTDALVAASSEELRRELEPELGISQEDRLQLQSYNRAQELVEELHGLSGHLRERTLLVPMPTTARNRKDWRY